MMHSLWTCIFEGSLHLLLILFRIGLRVDIVGLYGAGILYSVDKHLALVVRVLHVGAHATWHRQWRVSCWPTTRHGSRLLVNRAVGIAHKLAHNTLLLAEVARPTEHVAAIVPPIVLPRCLERSQSLVATVSAL